MSQFWKRWQLIVLTFIQIYFNIFSDASIYNSSLIAVVIDQYLVFIILPWLDFCFFNILLRWFNLNNFLWLSWYTSSKSFFSFDSCICFSITAFVVSLHLSSHRFSANWVLDESGKFTKIKFNRFVTVNCLFAGNMRVSLLSNIVVALLSSLIAGKKSTVGTERAVNCHGRSFSAASMVKNFISADL